jgi:NADPH-dependent ferric siderophore reductase
MNEMSLPRHNIVRMRREVRRRQVTVSSVSRLTPKMQRVTFTSPELHDFESLGFDDHIKLFVPTPTAIGGDGQVCARDYTPRAFDPSQGTLTIDFALHQAGPATAWALAARPGETIEIGGPRGSTIVTDDFDWYLLIGDETALPAIGRRLETLRPGVPVKTMVIVDGPPEHQAVLTPADWEPTWIDRTGATMPDAERLLARLTSAGPLPKGDGYIWIAGEAQLARSLRGHVLATLGHPRPWLKASGYWLSGQANAHVTIEE